VAGRPWPWQSRHKQTIPGTNAVLANVIFIARILRLLSESCYCNILQFARDLAYYLVQELFVFLDTMCMFYIYFRFIGLSCESEMYLSMCICAQSFKCHSKVTSDFVFVGSSSLIATAGHSADNRNVCLWDTLLPQRRALVQGLIRTMLLCFTFVDIMMMFHVRNILCYNVKLSRC